MVSRPTLLVWICLLRASATLMFSGLMLHSGAVHAQTSTNIDQRLIPLWSNSVSGRTQAGQESGLILIDIARASDGSLVVLAENDGRPILLLGPNATGPGRSVELRHLSGSGLKLTSGVNDTLWISGYEDSRYSLFGGYLSEGYLVKLDKKGSIKWERRFGSQTERNIQSVASLPTGDVVVSGKDRKRTWLARISDEGNLVWERFFALGKGSSVIAIGETLLVATFDVHNNQFNQSYQEDVTLFVFSDTGQLLERYAMREAINNNMMFYFGNLSLVRSDDAIYLISEWGGIPNAKPVGVSKLNFSGKPIWTRELPETSTAITSGAGKTRTCSIIFTALDGGDLMIGCIVADRIQFIRLNSQTGTSTVTRAVRPYCSNGAPTSVLFLAPKDLQTLWVFGSKPLDWQAPSCTWLSEMSAGQY
jgi:hypothetical protein